MTMVGWGVEGRGGGLLPSLAGVFTSSPCCGSPGLVGTREDSRFLGCCCGRHNASEHPTSGSRRGLHTASRWWGSRRAPSPPALLGAMRRDLDGSSAQHPRERGLPSSSTVMGPAGLSVEMPEAPAARACSRAISFLREESAGYEARRFPAFSAGENGGAGATKTQLGLSTFSLLSFQTESVYTGTTSVSVLKKILCVYRVSAGGNPLDVSHAFC